MILNDEQIQALRRKGIKVTGADGKPTRPKLVGRSEIDYLRSIYHLLETISNRPDPVLPVPSVSVQAPEVTVQAPEVIVPPPPERIKRWEFVLTKNAQGQTTHITATAA